MAPGKLLLMCLLGAGSLITTIGCGASSSPSDPSPQPKGAQPAPVLSSVSDGLPRASVKQVHAAPINAAHRSWSAVVTTRSTRSITLLYLESKGAGCSSVYRANVVESDSWVEIQLLTRAGDPSQPCAQIGVRTLATIHLDKDLGSRQLLEPNGGT